MGGWPSPAEATTGMPLCKVVATMTSGGLERFARRHGLQFAQEPAARRTPVVFRQYDEQKLVGWFGVPGPTGYEVGQSIRQVSFGDPESATTSRLTWASFTLRTGSAGDARALTTVSSIAPAGWRSPRRWRW